MKESAGNLSHNGVLLKALRDSRHHVLEKWEQLLSKDGTRLWPELRQAVAELLEGRRTFHKHLTEEATWRYGENNDLAELLSQYSVLRAVALEEVSQRLGRNLHANEFSEICRGIDGILAHDLITYVHDRTREFKAIGETQKKYVSLMSHELRGGLNGTLLMIEVLRRQLAAEPRFSEAMRDLELARRSIMETIDTMDKLARDERMFTPTK